jgi:glycosyltransferase involved in cell wall biosynthesis
VAQGDPRRRVVFDGTAFFLHRWSGISRYFAELIAAFDDDPSLGVEPVTPYHFVSNMHLASSSRGFRNVPLPHRHRRRVLDRLNRRSAKRGAADGLVTHFPLYQPDLLEAARSGPSVTTVYDFTIEVQPELFGDASEHLETKRAYLQSCEALVCISETTRRDLQRFHPDLDKPVLVTPLAVADEFRHIADRPVRGLPERYLLHVGNRAEHKNLELVLRAFRELVATDRDLHLVLSGQGLPGETERIAELGITDRTRIVRLSDGDLPGAYRHAKAFVFPSRYEGFGLPVLEAMTAGCPTLISDAPALVEVTDGAAEVVAPDDLDGAVAALHRLISDPVLADQRRAAGVLRARAFSWQRTARDTVAAYDCAARLRGRG